MQYIMHVLVSFLHHCLHALFFNISTKSIDFITQKEKSWKRTSNNKDNLAKRVIGCCTCLHQAHWMTTSHACVVYCTSMACRLYARSNDIHDNNETQNSWQSIARWHLHGARLKLKHLALSMSKEMPDVLLEYLSPSAPPLLSSLNKQVQASTSCLQTQTDTSANSDTKPDDGCDSGHYAQLASHDSEAHLQDSDACSQDSYALSTDWHTRSVTSSEVSEMLAKATARITERERAISSANFPDTTTQLSKHCGGLDQAEAEYELLQASLKPSLDTIANLQSDRHSRHNSTGPLSNTQVTKVVETDSSDSDASSCCIYSISQAICKARPQSTADIKTAAAAPAATQHNPFTAMHAASEAGSGQVQTDCVESRLALQAANTAQYKSASQAATASGNAVAAAAAALVAARAASERASTTTSPAVAAAAAPAEPTSDAASAAEPAAAAAAAAASARRSQKPPLQTASPAAALTAKMTTPLAETRAEAVPLTEATDSEAKAAVSASSSAASLVVMKNLPDVNRRLSVWPLWLPKKRCSVMPVRYMVEQYGLSHLSMSGQLPKKCKGIKKQ